LATNSAKYGALSSEDGHLDVSWTDKADTLVVVWAETGGPSVSAPPERQGFGSRLIRSTIRGQFAGTIAYDWAPTGLVVTLSIKRRRVGNAGFPALERKPHLR
jgi:two-component sensor histidine kinase